MHHDAQSSECQVLHPSGEAASRGNQFLTFLRPQALGNEGTMNIGTSGTDCPVTRQSYPRRTEFSTTPLWKSPDILILFCDELIARPEESYRLWCVAVCDLETSWMRRPWRTGGLLHQKKILDLTISLYHCLLGRVKFDERKILAGTFHVVTDFCYFQSVPNFMKLRLRFCVCSDFYFPSTFVSYTVQLEVKFFVVSCRVVTLYGRNCSDLSFDTNWCCNISSHYF